MPECMRLLREEHVNLSKLLDALEHQLKLFDEAASPDYDVMAGVLEYCQTYPDEFHHPLEDLVCSKLRKRDPHAAAAVGDLEGHHEKLEAATDRLAEVLKSILLELEVSRAGFDELMREFIRSYRRHIQMEEEIFFPAAERALRPEDWAEIDAQIANPEDPVFGAAEDERFADLRAYVLSLDSARP